MIPLKERCKQEVSGTGTWGVFHRHQCNRRAVKDGYCKQHHPDSVKKRQEESEERYHEKMQKDPLRLAHEQLKKYRNCLDQINLLIGNVDHSKGNGSKSAKMRGQLLNDIRDMINSLND